MSARLAYLFFRRNLGASVALCLMALVAGVLATATTQPLFEARATYDAGRASSIGGGLAQVNPLRTGVATDLLGYPELLPIWSSDVTIRTDDALVLARVRDALGHLAFGSLLDGRRPANSDEVTVNLELARTLRLNLDDEISVFWPDGHERTQRVSGIVVVEDAAQSMDVYASTTVAKTTEPTRFIVVAPLPADLAAANEAREFRMQTPDVLALFASDAEQFGWLTRFKFVALTGALVTLALFGGFRSAVFRISDPQLDVLARLGMPRARVRRIQVMWAGALLAIGYIAGAFAYDVFGRRSQQAISRLVNQYWGASAVRPLTATLFIGAGLCLLGLRRRPRPSRVGIRATERPWQSVAWVVAAGVGLFAAVTSSFLVGAVGAFVLGVFGSRLGALSFVATGTESVTSLVRRTLSQGLQPVISRFVLLAVAITASSLWILSGIAEDRLSYGSFLDGLAPGSIQIEGLDSDVAATLFAAFAELGGETTVHQVVADEPTTFRIVSAATGTCVETAANPTFDTVFACAGNGEVGGLATSWNGPPPTGAIWVAPRLLDGPAGTVAVVVANNDGISRVEYLVAQSFPANLGSATTSGILTTEAAQLLGISPSGTAAMAFLGVADLGPEISARVRGLVDEHAGALVVNDDPGFQDGGRFGLVLVLVIGGSTLLAMLGSTWVGASASIDVVQDALRRLRASPRYLRRLLATGTMGMWVGAIAGSLGSYVALGSRRRGLVLDDNAALAISSVVLPSAVLLIAWAAGLVWALRHNGGTASV